MKLFNLGSLSVLLDAFLNLHTVSQNVRIRSKNPLCALRTSGLNAYRSIEKYEASRAYYTPRVLCISLRRSCNNSGEIPKIEADVLRSVLTRYFKQMIIGLREAIL